MARELLEGARTNIARQRHLAGLQAEADRQYGLMHHDLAELLEADKHTRVANWFNRIAITLLAPGSIPYAAINNKTLKLFDLADSRAFHTSIREVEPVGIWITSFDARPLKFGTYVNFMMEGINGYLRVDSKGGEIRKGDGQQPHLFPESFVRKARAEDLSYFKPVVEEVLQVHR